MSLDVQISGIENKTSLTGIASLIPVAFESGHFYEQTQQPGIAFTFGGSFNYPAGAPYATNFDAYADGYGILVSPSEDLLSQIPPLIWGKSPLTATRRFAMTAWTTSGGQFDGDISPWPVNYTGVFLGLAKNITKIALPYLIVRLSLGGELLNHSHIVAGVPTVVSRLEIFQQGTIQPGQIIGLGQDITFPFLGYAAADGGPPKIGNNASGAEYYFATINQTPADFLKNLMDSGEFPGITAYGDVTAIS